MSSNPLEAAYKQWVATPTADNLNALFSEVTYTARRAARKYSNLDTDELSQQAIVTAWEDISRYDPDRCSLTAWVTTILRNRAMSTYRTSQRTETRMQDVEDIDQILVDVPTRQLEDPLYIIGDYSPEEGQLLTALGSNRKRDEIANRMGISRSALRSRIARLRKKMKWTRHAALPPALHT